MADYQRLLDADTRNVPAVLREERPGGADTAPLSAERYIGRDFFERECERLWPHVWQMACREEEIAKVGDVHVYDIVDRSILIVRSAEDRIQAFHNVCLHRGRKLLEQSGRAESIRCGFHGWTWELGGSLKRMPCRSEFDHLTDEALTLPEVRVACWGGFVFINMDPKASPLETYLGVLPDHFDRWRLEECYKAAHVARVIPCNWKVAQEAFMESYHVVATHPQILPFFDDVGSEYDVYGPHVNRNLAAFGVPSPHLGGSVTDAAVLDGMYGLWGRRREAGEVPAGGNGTVRGQLGEAARSALQRTTATDLDGAADAEMLDAIVYNVFPNFAPWGGFAPNIVYRWRPNGRDVDSCIMEVMILKRPPKDGMRPDPVPVHWLGADEPWSAATELPVLGPVIDQDMSNMPLVQQGLKASATGTVHLARYMESRIRHFHATLDRYLAGDSVDGAVA